MARLLNIISALGDFMKGLFGFLVFAMFMVCVSYANAEELTTSQKDTAVAPPTADVVLIVDRNPKVQELKVIEAGSHTKTFPISTGRETFDFNEGNYKINPYCSFTETTEEYNKANPNAKIGHFRVQRLREMNISDTWSSRDAQGKITSKTRMPHATFFNGGTAFHAVDTSTEYGKGALAKLGPKDNPANGGSGACVRLSPENAKYVFDLFATIKPDGTYEKADPRQWDECKVAAGQTMSHKCTDPDQWPVPRKKQNVQIKIVDSRTPEEQAAAHKKCNDVKSAFLADKAKCLASKINPNANAPAPAPIARTQPKPFNLFQKIGNFFSGKKEQEVDEASAAFNTAPFDLKQELAKLPADQRVKFNEECNREGHQKIKAGQLKAPTKPVVRPPVKPAPLPTNVKDAKPAPAAPEKRPSTNGLWMDYSV